MIILITAMADNTALSPNFCKTTPLKPMSLSNQKINHIKGGQNNGTLKSTHELDQWVLHCRQGCGNKKLENPDLANGILTKLNAHADKVGNSIAVGYGYDLKKISAH